MTDNELLLAMSIRYKIEIIQADVDVMKKVIKEHSQALEKLA